MAQMYNENTHVGVDGLTNLQRFMQSISSYADGLVMFDDGSTDDSLEYVKSWDSKLDIETPGNPPGENNFKNELYHKARSLEHCRRLKADWVLWLDSDEGLQHNNANKSFLEVLCKNAEACGADAMNLFERNLWRTDRYYRVDELWARGLFCRFWKMSDKLSFNVKKGLHHDLSPSGLHRRINVLPKVIHYGYADDESIMRKYHLYKSHGQSGHALNRMIDERTLRLEEACPEWFNENWPCGPKLDHILTRRLSNNL